MIELLKMFSSIVESKSINRASQRLNITQPALSRQIRKLEHTLGVPLFERKGKKLELTRIGRVVLDYADKFDRLEHELREAIAEFHLPGTGTMTIGASLTTLQSTLPQLVSLYMKDYPRANMKVITGKTHEIVSLTEERKIDLGLIASAIENPLLHCDRLFDDHLCLIVPKNHPFTIKFDIKLKQLNRLPMVLFSKGTWYRTLMDNVFHKHRITPDVKMEIDSFEAIIRMVATGAVSSLLPKSYVGFGFDQSAVTVLDVEELLAARRTTSLIYFEQHELSASAVQFIAKAKNLFSV